MRTLKKFSIGLFATSLLLFAAVGINNAQTKGEVIKETNKSMVLRIESNNALAKPSKILFVYETDLITHESSSLAKEYKLVSLKSGARHYSAGSGSSLASALELETEEEMEIEDWMLRPFNSPPAYLIPEKEEEMAIEPWMTDLSLWKINSRP